MKKYVLAIGLTVATTGVVQADCVRTMANEGYRNHQYAYGRNIDGTFHEIARGDLPVGATVEFTLAAENGAMEFRFLEPGETDMDKWLVAAFVTAEKVAACRFGLLGDDDLCFDYPSDGYITFMDPSRNCGLAE